MNPYSYQSTPNQSSYSLNGPNKSSLTYSNAFTHSNGTINPTFPGAFPSYNGFLDSTMTIGANTFPTSPALG